MNATRIALADVLGHEMTDKRIDILRRIGEVGSISEAARGAQVSYKAAWQAIEALNNLAGQPLVNKMVGGSRGGGAALTPAGLQVLAAAQAMATARQQIMSRFSDGQATPVRAVMAMRTSMRNQFPCVVVSLKKGLGQVRVKLQLNDRQCLHARITAISAQLLNLKPGLEVLAMCKATAIEIKGASTAPPDSNLLAGQVARWPSQRTQTEITLETAGGIQVFGFASKDHAPRSGAPGWAAFDESALVIATLQ